jgi:hypothetical protein
MEFSTRVERRNAIEATTVIDHTAAMKAKSIRTGISASGIKTMPNVPY